MNTAKIFPTNLDSYVGSCNTRKDISNKVRIPNKTEDLNLIIFNIITGINELETLTKHIPSEYKCRLDGRKRNSNQYWINDKCWCESKKHHVCERDYVWNPSTCSCENGKYLASIMDDSVINLWRSYTREETVVVTCRVIWGRNKF